MAPHKPRKSVPTEYTTDEEDMIVYDGEDEPEPIPELILNLGGYTYKGEFVNKPNQRCCQGVRHRSQRCFTAVEVIKTTGMCSRRHGEGRVRSTTPAEHKYIVLLAKRNRRTTAQQVANQFLAASGKQISRKTVARRLRRGGLYARRPIVCVPLTRQHRTARLQWCREHHNWTE
ncbi:transposable element Tc1 transposase [Trichonephila clavipes]|nr:transposable element Tc1 transposase [Trichonephila clavipes]